MKKGFFLGLLAQATLASAAHATDRAACLEAASSAQTLRDAHKLVEAREALRVCAASPCPVVVQTDCATWLAEVEQGLPTVVITAADGAGHDRFDVRVTVDGQAPPFTLEGRAMPMNPGPHALHFEAGGAVLDQQILVKEGVKNQSFAVVLPRGRSNAGPAAGTPPKTGSPGDGVSTGGSRAWRTAGWVVSGAGVAGLAVGAIFGLEAISDKNGAHCDASNACDAGPLGDANTAATISTVGVVAGGALLVAGAALLFFAPAPDGHDARAPAPLRLRVAPLVGARDGGLVVGGAW